VKSPDDALVLLLALFSAALFLVPDRYTVPIGSRLGLRPHQIVVLVAALILVQRFVRGSRHAIGRPALVAGLLVVTTVISMVVNNPRLNEASFLASFRLLSTTMLHVLLAAVVCLLATTPRRRRLIVGAMATMIALSALYAIHESATEEPVRFNPTPPGLVEELDAANVGDPPSTVVRNGVARPAGAAATAIELSAVMALGLSFAMYLVFSANSAPTRLWFITCSLLIAVGLVLSISRTGVLAISVMSIVALVLNVKRPRFLLIGLGAVVILAFGVASLVPESVDATFEQLGKSGDEDPSLATRLQDYQELDNLLGPFPWFGRGPDALDTYVARDGGGLILDNQYLLLIAETGVLGLAALTALLVSAGAAASRLIRTTTTERGLWVAALSAVVAFSLMAATFDVLRFSQATSIFMIVVGLVSAVDRRAPHVSTVDAALGGAR
jgi:O-antigen ligase